MTVFLMLLFTPLERKERKLARQKNSQENSFSMSCSVKIMIKSRTYYSLWERKKEQVTTSLLATKMKQVHSPLKVSTF